MQRQLDQATRFIGRAVLQGAAGNAKHMGGASLARCFGQLESGI